MLDRARLRTPGGQLWLIALTFGVAVVLAGVMAGNRAFFERHVGEKVPEPPGTTVSLLERLEAGEAAGDDLANLGVNDLAALYNAWMRADAVSDESPAPALLMELDPAYFRSRVERTLAGGSLEQRRRALVFIRAARDPVFLSLARWALVRFSHTETLREEAAGTLEALERGRVEGQPGSPADGLESMSNVESWHAVPVDGFSSRRKRRTA